MGNDRNFIQAEDLPFYLIEIPVDSAPVEDYSSNKICRNNINVDGYDAPPSLLPPPIIFKTNDKPSLNIRPRSKHQKFYLKHSSCGTKYQRKNIHKRKSTCCVIS